MTDTPMKRILFTIKNGVDNICKRSFNYTNEYWYNFKSYVCGSQVSFVICNKCNNYKHLSRNDNYITTPSNTRFLCKCNDINYIFDDNILKLVEQECLFDSEFDDFDTVFVDIMNSFNNYCNETLNNNHMSKSIHIE